MDIVLGEMSFGRNLDGSRKLYNSAWLCNLRFQRFRLHTMKRIVEGQGGSAHVFRPRMGTVSYSAAITAKLDGTLMVRNPQRAPRLS